MIQKPFQIYKRTSLITLSYSQRYHFLSKFKNIFDKIKILKPDATRSTTFNQNTNTSNIIKTLDETQNNKITTASLNNFTLHQKSNPLQQSLWPSFVRLDDDFIKAHTSFSMENQLYSPFRWTPLIQKHPISDEFMAGMKRMSRVTNWKEHHSKELVDIFIFEALKGTQFDYYYDYRCMPSKACLFNGTIDFFIYNKESNHIPFIPVFISKKKRHPYTREMIDNYSVPEAVGGSIWALNNMLATDKNFEFVRTLHTNGHVWKMYEFTKKGEFKKTGFYIPNSPESVKKIYFDLEAQQVILGLIRYACTLQSEKEKELKKFYDLMDESKYLVELDPELKEKMEKRKRLWKFLPKGLHDFFFDFDKK